VKTEFYDFEGNLKQVSAATLVAVLTALGMDCTDPGLIYASLNYAKDAEWRNFLPPTVVVKQGEYADFPVHVVDGAPVSVWVELFGSEVGAPAPSEREHWGMSQVDRYVEPRTVDGVRTGRATFSVPTNLPLGWHVISADSDGKQASTTLVVTPNSVSLPASVNTQVWGLLAQLYSVRSSTSWGVGDFSDLADLAWLAARKGGADFLAVNPMHAAEPIPPMTPSPYLPTSRRFLNPMYIRVEDIPETAYLSGKDRGKVEWAFTPVQKLNTDPGPIDRDAVWAAKKAALEVVYTAPRRTLRESEYQQFISDEGQGLQDFAAWCAITEALGTMEWPAEYSQPTAPAVVALREKLTDRIDFYIWLQWIADQQKQTAQAVAKQAGMRIGIMHDLAVGVHPTGADAWANAPWLATGVSVGAPPDMYNQQGQNWSQPPWNPRALASVGYKPYREMLRSVLRGAGALRADHVLGLFRLWWIPDGMGADQGTYVTYDHDAMIGILLLEASKVGAIVVGEDLGTFEPWVRDYLAGRGLLGTSVEWFEWENGYPMPPEHYRHLCMASVGTHDMPPTAGYLAGEHVDLRDRLGLLTEPIEKVRADAAAERQKFVDALRGRGLVGDDPSEREIVEAMHRYLRLTPSALLGVQLVDAVGERRSQNQPGTDQEYPNWKIPLGDASGAPVLVDDLFKSQRLLSLVGVLNTPVN
jgi:4-alpha-glucanotransferase